MNEQLLPNAIERTISELQAEIDTLRQSRIDETEDYQDSLKSLYDEIELVRKQLSTANDGLTEAYMLGVHEGRERNLQEINVLRRQNETLQHQLAELAKLAITPGQWKPVEDGVLPDAEPDKDDLNRRLRIWHSGKMLSVHWLEDGTGSTMDFCLPENVRLCQRVEAEWQDAPDSAGDWIYVCDDPPAKRIINITRPHEWQDHPLGWKWHRLNIAWPGESES